MALSRKVPPRPRPNGAGPRREIQKLIIGRHATGINALVPG